MARDPTTGYKQVERKPVSTQAPPRKPKKLPAPVTGMAEPLPLLSGGPPVTPLLSHGVQLNIQDVNDKVEKIVTAHKNAVGYPPKPALVFDILKADPHIQKAGISYDQLFGVPKNTRQQDAMVAARTAVNPIDPIATLPVLGAKVPTTAAERAVADYTKRAKPVVHKRGLPPDYGYTNGLGLAPNDQVQLAALADIGRPIGFVWKATKQIIDTTASLPAGMAFMASSIGADVRDFATYGMAPLAEATNNLPLPGPQQHFKQRTPDFHRTRELGLGMAKGIWYDVTHPYDQAGYLMLDLFGGYSLGASLGARGAHAAAATGVRASAKTFVKRPPPGYFELGLGGYSESIPMFNNAGARTIQTMVLKRRQKKLGDSLVGDVVMEHNQLADLVFSSQVYLKRATDNKVAIQYGILMAPSVEFTRLSGFRARAGIAMDAIKSDPKLIPNFRTIGKSKIAAMDKAVEIMFTDEPLPTRVTVWRNYHERELQNLQSLERDIRGSGTDMEAMTDQEISNALRNVSYQVENHKEQLRMIDVAESMLKNPIRQWPEYLRRAQAVADAQEHLKKLWMGLDEEVALQAVAKMGAFVRRDPLVNIGDGKLGVVQPVYELQRPINPDQPLLAAQYSGAGALVPTEDLMKALHLDFRVVEKTGLSGMSVSQLTESLKKRGFERPVEIDYDYEHNTITVGNGNHRVLAAHNAGVGHVPVVFSTMGDAVKPFYEGTRRKEAPEVVGLAAPVKPMAKNVREKFERETHITRKPEDIKPPEWYQFHEPQHGREGTRIILKAPVNGATEVWVAKKPVGQSPAALEKNGIPVKDAEGNEFTIKPEDVKETYDAINLDELAYSSELVRPIKPSGYGYSLRLKEGEKTSSVEIARAIGLKAHPTKPGLTAGELFESTSSIPDVKKLEQGVASQERSLERASRLVKSAEAKLRAADARDAKAGREPRQRLKEDAAKPAPLGEEPTDVRGRALLNVEETLEVRRGYLATKNTPEGDFRHLGNFKDTKGRIIGEYVSKDERVLVDLNTGESIQRTKLGEKPKVAGARTDEQVVTDARKHLKELEKKHDAFFDKFREKMFGKQTPEDKAEQLKRNEENAKFKRQQEGKNRSGKGAGYSGKKVPSLQKTVKEEQNLLVDQAIDQFVKDNPDSPAVQTMLAERAEILQLKEQLNPMPGEAIDANMLRSPDEPRPTAEELSGVKVKAALTHEEEALRRAQAQEKRAQRGLAQATGALEKVREDAKPLIKKVEESRYYPSRRRIYAEGTPASFQVGRKNKYGVGPVELPASLRYRNDGTSLVMGDRRWDTSDLLPEELMMTTKTALQIKVWHDLWESGLEVPSGTMTHPIRDIRNAPQHLKEWVQEMDRSHITMEAAEHFTEGNLKELREWATREVSKEVKKDEHVRYVDDRMLMDYFTDGQFWRAADQRMSNWTSWVNDPLRFLMIFATPAYLLNALGSSVTLLSEYQMGAMPNLGRSLWSSRIWDDEVTRLLDIHGGQTHTASMMTERGPFTKTYQGVAEMWQLVTDRPFRRAAVIGELRRAKVPLDEMSLQEVKDVLSLKDTTYEKEVIGAAQRAQSAMLNFSKMSWPERAILRHLVFVYAFMRASAAWSIRFQVEHPLQSLTLAQAGKERAQQIDEHIGNVDEWFMRRGYFHVGKGLWFDPIQANMPGMLGEVAYPFMSLFRDTPYASIQDTLGPGAQIASSLVTGRDAQGRDLPDSGYGRVADTAIGAYQMTPFGYAGARAEKRKAEKPLPPASVSPDAYAPQEAALDQERAARDLSPFELDSWWQTWGRNIGRSAIPYKIDEAALNARYWRTTKENNLPAYEQHQIDSVIGKGGMIDRMEQLAGESSGPEVMDGVQMIMRVALFVDKEASDWKKHHLTMPNPGPRAKGIWTIDSLLEQGKVTPAQATAMKKELNAAPPRLQDQLRKKAMLDNGGKAWMDWNAHVQKVNWFGKQSYIDTVGMLAADGVGDFSGSIHAAPEAKWSYGRRFLVWEEERRQLSAQADKAGPDKQVRKAELIEFENQSKPVTVNGVTFPSYAALRYGRLAPEAQAAHKLAVSMRPWETLNSFDRSLVVKDVNEEAAQGWTALAQVRAREQAKLPLGKKLPPNFTKQVAVQIAKQSPAFGRDYNFSKEPLAKRMSTFTPLKESRFADEWSTLLGTAAARYDALHKQKAPQGFINDQWARNDVPKVHEWIAQQSKGFQAQVLLYEKDHPDFLKDLVKP